MPLNTCWSGSRTPTSSCWAFSRAAQAPRTKLRQHNDRINAILAQCKLPRTTYANINRRFLDSSGKLLPGISRDNLHFTEKGYAIWADAVLPYIKKYCK